MLPYNTKVLEKKKKKVKGLQAKKHKNKYNRQGIKQCKAMQSRCIQGYRRAKQPAKSNNVLQVFFIHSEHQKDGKGDEKSQIDQTKADPPVMANAG